MAASIKLYARNRQFFIELSGSLRGTSLSGFVFKLYNKRNAVVHSFIKFEIPRFRLYKNSNVSNKYKLLLLETNLHSFGKNFQQNKTRLFSICFPCSINFRSLLQYPYALCSAASLNFFFANALAAFVCYTHRLSRHQRCRISSTKDIQRPHGRETAALRRTADMFSASGMSQQCEIRAEKHLHSFSERSSTLKPCL